MYQRYVKQRMQHADRYKLSNQSLQTTPVLQTAQTVHASTPDSPISTDVPQNKLQGQRGLQRPTQRQEVQPQGRHRRSPAPERLQTQYWDYTCNYCGSWPHRIGEECKASNQECYNCGKLGHFSKVCRQRSDYQNNDKTAVKHINMEEQPPDYFQSEYTTPYYVTNRASKSPHRMPQDYNQSPPHSR